MDRREYNSGQGKLECLAATLKNLEGSLGASHQYAPNRERCIISRTLSRLRSTGLGRWS